MSLLMICAVFCMSWNRLASPKIRAVLRTSRQASTRRTIHRTIEPSSTLVNSQIERNDCSRRQTFSVEMGMGMRMRMGMGMVMVMALQSLSPIRTQLA